MNAEVARLAFVLARLLTPFASTPTGDALSAHAFFERGREAAARGDAKSACRNFEESLRLDLAVGTLFNLAQCEEQLGRLASAWQHLREGIGLLSDADPRREPAIVAAAELDLRVPRLAVRLDGTEAPGTRVFRDGVELSEVSLGTPLPVNPGAHAVVVRSVGRPDRSFDVSLAPGENRVLVVRPADVPRAKPPRGSGDAGVGGWLSVAGLASLGIGPSTTIGGRAGATLELRRLSVGLDLAAETTPSDVEVGRERVMLLAASGGVTPCYRFGHFLPCAFARAGLARGEATTVDTPTVQQSPVASIGIRAAADIPLHRTIALFPAIDAGVSLVRTRLDVDGRALWTAPVAYVSFSFGARTRIF